MLEALSILLFPFMACVLLVIAHAWFGVHVIRRGIIFVDLSLAQFIGLGTALSFFLGQGEGNGAAFSLGFAALGAFILSFSRTISRLANIEAFIGVLYIFSLSASMLVLDRTPHGMGEFKAILSGSILWVTPGELLSTLALYSAIGLFHFIFRNRFLALSFEGRGGGAWEFLFFLSFALVLVKSVQMAGVLQVFAFLVIPVLVGKLLTDRLKWQLVLGWALGAGASLLGLVLSYTFDLPAAPLIVASLCLLFFALLALRLAGDAARGNTLSG